MSGKQYNILLIESLSENVLHNLEYDVKSLKQLEEQLGERANLINIILYVRKFTHD